MSSYKRVETQKTISDWGDSVFGPVSDIGILANRVAKEVVELVDEILKDDVSDKAGEEMADVAICLYRLAEWCGVDLDREIDQKMQINRKRKWVKDGFGCGYHQKE